MTREIHYPLLILSVLTGALATFVAMAALLGPQSLARLDGCASGTGLAGSPNECRPGTAVPACQETAIRVRYEGWRRPRRSYSPTPATTPPRRTP